MKGKNRQNQSLVTEVKVVIALGEKVLVTGREHTREPSGMLGMFDTHMYICQTIHLEPMHLISIPVCKSYLNFSLVKINEEIRTWCFQDTIEPPHPL